MGAFKRNDNPFEPITISLGDYEVKDLMPSILFAQASAELGMSPQERDEDEQKDEKWRGMFCEDWFIRTNPLGFSRNTDADRRAPEMVLGPGFGTHRIPNTLWDFKSVLKTCRIHPSFNLYIPTANYCKDKKFRPPLMGYVGAALQFPVPTAERRKYTVAIFEQERYELLLECAIHVVGWITMETFKKVHFVCEAGQDLNRGDGPTVKAMKDNVGVFFQDLTSFKKGRGAAWPYMR